ncbi:hypothetical protein P43SY_009540 [Pythium insidiosum]|uniref:Uncharacterized protein n=1 Tax=Pythium insidiosum TaxID=114742 RepID=A0AAD5Q6Y8_PYTIN|nr:hypothetical protein P43SY_009540 [Pythium insidiosum]
MATAPALTVADPPVLIPEPIAFQAAQSFLPNDALLRVALTASDDVTKSAVPVLATVCRQDLSKWCSEPVSLAVEAKRVASQNPSLVIEALRHVHGCLARNVDSLSPPCADSLMRELVAKALSSSTGVLQPSRKVEDIDDGNPSSKKTKANARHPKRHHRGDDDDDDDDDDDGDGYDHARERGDGGVEIYIFNARSDDSRRRVGHGRDRDDGDGVHPLVWLVVLPFFFIGLAVVAKRVHTYARHRLRTMRERERERSRGSSDAVPLVVPAAAGYAPLKTTDDGPL